MAKGKKRPWIQAKLAASTAADGDSGDGARLAEMERERRRRKAADRAARERAFRERHPERFVEDDSGDAPPGDVGDAGARASDATRDALDDARQPWPVGDGAARRGGGGRATSSRGRGDDQHVAHARPPAGTRPPPAPRRARGPRDTPRGQEVDAQPRGVPPPRAARAAQGAGGGHHAPDRPRRAAQAPRRRVRRLPPTRPPRAPRPELVHVRRHDQRLRQQRPHARRGALPEAHARRPGHGPERRRVHHDAQGPHAAPPTSDARRRS